MNETQDTGRVSYRPTRPRKETLEVRGDHPLGADTAELLLAMPEPGEVIPETVLNDQFERSRRRMYDVMHVLCGLGLAARAGNRHRYQWHGPGGFVKLVIQLRAWGYRSNTDTSLATVVKKRQTVTGKMSMLEKAAYSTLVVLELGRLRDEPYMMNNGTEWEGISSANVVLGALDLCMPGHGKTRRIGYDVINIMEATGLIKHGQPTMGRRGIYTSLLESFFASSLGAYLYLESRLTGCDIDSIEIIKREDGGIERRLLVQSETTATEPRYNAAEAKRKIDEKRAIRREYREHRMKVPRRKSNRRTKEEEEEAVVEQGYDADREALTLSAAPKRIKTSVAGDELFPELAHLDEGEDCGLFQDESPITFIPYDLGIDLEMVQ